LARRVHSREARPYEYTVRGWTDPFLTWQRDLKKRRDAGQDLSVDFLIGAELASSDLKKILGNAALKDEERYERRLRLRRFLRTLHGELV